MKKIILLSFVLLSQNLFANFIGYTSHRNEEAQDRFLLSSGIYGGNRNGYSAGVDLRGTFFYDDKLSFDAGMDFSTSDFSSYRYFGGVDIILFPDYQYQPQISIKSIVEYSKINDKNQFLVGLAPTFSKSFTLEDLVIHPYIALPWRLELDNPHLGYLNFSFGATSKFEKILDGQWLANFELNINLRNADNTFLFGVAHRL